MDSKPLATPDITWAQVLAAVTAVVGLFVTQNYIDQRLAQLITGIASIVGPLVWVAADAVIRHGRARAFAIPPKGVVAEEHEPLPLKTTVKRTRK
jgi:hypothetical protein